MSAIDTATDAWGERNRYMRDLLSTRIEGDEDPWFIVELVEPSAEDDR